MSRLLARRISSNLARLSTRAFSLSGAPIDISPEVKDALNTGRPVVALETAIVTHGLPYPINLETALEVEGQVRAGGAVPATIGVVDGRIAVGLEKAQLEMLADPNVVGKVKMSRRDLAVAVGLKKSGGTTIAGTSVIAATAGIPVSEFLVSGAAPERYLSADLLNWWSGRCSSWWRSQLGRLCGSN